MDAAETSYRRCLAIGEKVYGTREHYSSAETEVSLGLLLLEKFQIQEGLELLRHAHQVFAAHASLHPLKAELETVLKDLQEMHSDSNG